MSRRAFTMVELVIVLAIMTILLVPVGYMAIGGYHSFTALSMQASTKAECQRAAETLFRLAAAQGGYQVDQDHHGVTFSDGSRVRWQGDRLDLTHRGVTRSLLTESVKDFTAVRHHDILTLNLTVEGKRQVHGSLVRLHEIYDYPRVGLP
ncbi:type II secretion system protein [bacterium]|nr:type II secretion system protein [bacterium]